MGDGLLMKTYYRFRQYLADVGMSREELIFDADKPEDMEWLQSFIEGVERHPHPLVRATVEKLEVVESREITPLHPRTLDEHVG